MHVNSYHDTFPTNTIRHSNDEGCQSNRQDFRLLIDISFHRLNCFDFCDCCRYNIYSIFPSIHNNLL